MVSFSLSLFARKLVSELMVGGTEGLNHHSSFLLACLLVLKEQGFVRYMYHSSESKVAWVMVNVVELNRKIHFFGLQMLSVVI